uniref:Uncharacterized protein n=1 Tax=Siphoviridae sp. ctvok7 TaxID=2827596 RepID=A0A8S5LLC9_9CAUD|nr:MAG TPA: hypothetical protein [Siphoviridae sp. ctvok7]
MSGLEAIRITESRLSCSANTREAISFASALMVISIAFTSYCSAPWMPSPRSKSCRTISL